jgi:2-amino-4-hydroxy-6-hydroxymethyldihydropteridine diphosphokinase
MVRAFLALGSNVGDKACNLREALVHLGEVPGITLRAASSIYRTPPWGKLDQDWFANAAVEVETTLPPEALLASVLRIERVMGRVRDERWGPRIIDIDVLMHGETRMNVEHLHLPHPAMLDRAFVLVPLAEIAPGLILEGQSVEAHLAQLGRDGIEPMGSLSCAPALT